LAASSTILKREARFRHFLIPRKDFTVLPVWDTIGLGATGSHDVTVEDVMSPPTASTARRTALR
jgi:alkylation response protein AidB-like acyl-CoA dehydrogenase